VTPGQPASPAAAPLPVATLAPQPWMTALETRLLLQALAQDGGQARFVGGCVRDALLRRPVKDVDIATPLLPEQVIARCAAANFKVVPTGLAHGTVTVVVNHRPFEITTLRRDLETDGRHATVTFTDDWRADAARRDLTMNALFCDGAGRVTDFFGGVEDLRAGRVRFVGQARQRIEEDYLRLLRFFRFQAHYGRGEPDPEGLAAAVALAPRLERISAERKRDELMKLLAAPDPLPVLRVMQRHGVLDQVLRPDRDLAVRDLAVLGALLRAAPSADPLLRLAALLPPGRGRAFRAAEELRLSGEQRQRLDLLLDPPLSPRDLVEALALRRALHRLGPAAVVDFARLAVAQQLLALPDLALAQAAAAAWVPRALPVKGRDLLALGLGRGPALGALLRDLELWWLEQDFRPDAAALLAKARDLAKAP
jgi:poly(A) polymerase